MENIVFKVKKHPILVLNSILRRGCLMFYDCGGFVIAKHYSKMRPFSLYFLISGPYISTPICEDKIYKAIPKFLRVVKKMFFYEYMDHVNDVIYELDNHDSVRLDMGMHLIDISRYSGGYTIHFFTHGSTKIYAQLANVKHIAMFIYNTIDVLESEEDLN